MLRRRLIILTLVVCGLAGVAGAEDRPTAERYFRLGEKAYQAQNFAAAADNFEEAYKNFNLPEIAFSAAQAYRRLYRVDPNPEHVQRAVDHYKTYLGKVKSGGRVADAADALAEMQHELDKLIASGVEVSPALAKEYTRIVINPSLGKETGARMDEVEEGSGTQQVEIVAKLDGERVEAYAPMKVLPGKHTVSVSVDGYFPGEKEVVAPQGSTTIVDLPLQPRPAKVTIKTEAGARVTIDGRPAGLVPVPAQELAAGRHVITLSMRGRQPVAREVVVARGQEITLNEPLRMTTRRQMVPYLLGGAAVTIAVAGISTTFALLRDSDAEDMLYSVNIDGGWTPAELARYNRTRQARDRWRTAALLSGGALVGLATAAAVLYYTDNPGPDGVRVEPLTLPSGAGAAIAGGF